MALAERDSPDRYALREAFLKDWDAATADYRAVLERSSEAADIYAVLVIRSAIFLNGGGLVAIPATVALFGLSRASTAVPLIHIGAEFVVGLVVGVAAAAAAYFAITFNGLAAAAGIPFQEARLAPAHASQFPAGYIGNVEKLEVKFKRRRAWFIVFQFTAIGCCLASTALFLIGAWEGKLLVLRALG